MLSVSMSVPEGSTAGQMDGWISGVAEGDTQALAQFYGHTCAAVYGFALSILKNVQDAEDVLQDTYIQVWQGAKDYRSQGKPVAWLMTITRNLSLSRLRERAWESPVPPEDWRGSLEMMPAVTEEDRLTLEALMETLSDEERQVVTLHALTGLKYREIAGLLRLPLSTVLSRYQRSIKKLQSKWKESEEHG